MSRTKQLALFFWVVIGIALLWQFYDYNRGVTEAAIEHPQQEHFFFTNGTTAAASAPAPKQGPDVKQIAYRVQPNTPARGSFTCVVTLQNKGNAKAVGVQVWVRPYRGIPLFDEDVGHSGSGYLSDDDPLAQFGESLAFPDLAPGETSTQSVVFSNRTGVKPGGNPHPEITFQTEKQTSAK